MRQKWRTTSKAEGFEPAARGFGVAVEVCTLKASLLSQTLANSQYFVLYISDALLMLSSFRAMHLPRRTIEMSILCTIAFVNPLFLLLKYFFVLILPAPGKYRLRNPRLPMNGGRGFPFRLLSSSIRLENNNSFATKTRSKFAGQLNNRGAFPNRGYCNQILAC